MIDLNNCNVLCTGGCGFIGSNFIEYIDKNYNNLNIVNIDKWGVGHRKMSTHLFLNNNKYEEIPFDLSNLDPESDLFWGGLINRTKFDYIFHFAAESHVDRSISGPQAFIYNNVMGITKLLEMVRLKQPQARVINVSTDEVYGHLESCKSPPFTENSVLNPRSPYSASKASADMIANSYVTTYGLDIMTTRCCNNFGPHQHDEKLIPTVVKNLVKGSGIPIYGDGTNMREWIYVDDHNKSILEIAGTEGFKGVYNIGSSTELSNLSLIQCIANILDIKPKLRYVGDRKGHDFRYALKSIKYFRKFEPEHFPKALEKTVMFYADKYGGKTK
jgi:dTDP-glucose 4,6-dehydratase